MPVLSHLHQLFNAEQCQTYLHALRWKDRPLQCGVLCPTPQKGIFQKYASRMLM
jgi:hypothetical protein